MAVHIKSITFDCADPYRLAQFWRQLTGFSEDPDNGNAPDDPKALQLSPDESLALLSIAVPEPKHIALAGRVAGAAVHRRAGAQAHQEPGTS